MLTRRHRNVTNLPAPSSQYTRKTSDDRTLVTLTREVPKRLIALATTTCWSIFQQQ